MLPRQNAGDDLDAPFLAHLPDNRSYPLPQRDFQHLVAILRDPDDVVPMVKNRVIEWPCHVAGGLAGPEGSRSRQPHAGAQLVRQTNQTSEFR
jgi:hypothetical protein